MTPNHFRALPCASFSKYFWGAGHKESVDGFGAKVSAQRMQASRGVWGHAPLENFLNLDTHRNNLVLSGGFQVTKFDIWN